MYDCVWGLWWLEPLGHEIYFKWSCLGALEPAVIAHNTMLCTLCMCTGNRIKVSEKVWYVTEFSPFSSHDSQL